MNEITKDEIIILIKKFMDRWDKSDKLSWKDLLPIGKTTYKGYTLKISFGQGVRISGNGRPWIAFLKYNQTVSQGIYPIIGYIYKENKLDVLIGKSFQNEPEINENIISSIESNNMHYENSKDDINKIIIELDKIIDYFDSLMVNQSKVNIERINENLNLNIRNIILYGAPGVGKTHNYQNLISMIEDGKSQKDIFDTISKNEEVTLDSKTFETIKKEKRVEFVTFHQSYSYEDFIEGYRPNENNSIELEDGIFKRLSSNALNQIKENEYKLISFDEAYDILRTKYIENVINRMYSVTNIEILIHAFKEKTIKVQSKNAKDFQYVKKSDLSEVVEGILQGIVKKPSDIKKLNVKKDTISLGGLYFPIATKLVEIIRENKIDIEKEKNFYIVIDEINRGNISKIFGELITLIEEDKRDIYEVTLPYSKEKFKVPSNLYIIATMNSTDKSIATIDIALRRRFTFLKMKPNEDLVPTIAKKVFNDLNSFIKEHLSEDYKLGHSYFMKIQTQDDLEFVKEYKIKPLLEEYFYADEDNYKKAIDILNQNLKDDSND